MTTDAAKSTDELIDELTDLSPALAHPLIGDIDTTGAAGLIVKRLRGGRPGVVKKNKRKVLLPLDADEEDLHEAVGYEPGLYRVFLANAECKPIGDEYCEFTLTAEDMGFMSWGGHGEETVIQSIASIQKVNKGLLDTIQAAFLTSCDNQKAMIASLTNSYQGQAELIRANVEGFKALTAAKIPAPEPAEPEEIAREVIDQLDLDQEDEKPAQHWLIELLRTPPFSTVGPMVAQQWLAGKQAQAQAQAQARAQARAEAQAARAAATPPPAPAPPPAPGPAPAANGGGGGAGPVEYVTIHEDFIAELKAAVLRDIRSELAASIRAEISNAVNAAVVTVLDGEDHEANDEAVDESVAEPVAAEPERAPDHAPETSEPPASSAPHDSTTPPAISGGPELREMVMRMNNHAVDRTGPPPEPPDTVPTDDPASTRRSP